MRDDEKEIKILVSIVQSIASRDDKKIAIEMILKKLKPFRHSLARQFANKGVDFDDIVQQVDLKLIEAIHDYDETKDPSALRHLTARTRNGIWNYYRKEMNYFKEDKQMVSLDGGFILSEHESNDKYELALVSIIRDDSWNEDTIVAKITIEEELAKLTPHQREVLLMYFIDDKTQYSIAEELNINQANVSRAKKRAITQLRTNISELTLVDEQIDTDSQDE